MRKPFARPLAAVALMLSAALIAAACSNDNNSSSGGGGFQGVPLTGAGSTFAQPVYAAWAQQFLQVEPGGKVNYQAIGSGGGVEAFANKTVEFGATDVPLTADDVATLKGGEYVEFPTMVGAV